MINSQTSKRATTQPSASSPADQAKATKPVVPTVLSYRCLFYGLLDSPEDLQEIQICLKSWVIGFMEREWNDPEEISDGKLDNELFVFEVLDDMLDRLILNSYNPDTCDALSNECIASTFYSLSNELHTEKDLVRNWFMGFLPRFADRLDRFPLPKHLHAFDVLIELFYAFIYHHQSVGKINSLGETLYKLAA